MACSPRPSPGNGACLVDMSLHLRETLQAPHIERKKETLRRGWKEMPPWVFPTTTSTVINPDNFRYRVAFHLNAGGPVAYPDA